MKESKNKSNREIRIANAVAKYNDLRANESEFDLDEFLADYPDLKPELEEQIDILVEIEATLNAPEKDQDSFQLPAELSGYRILFPIGSGGMGSVLLAKDQRLERKLAIKVLSPRFWDNPVVRTRFMEEARSLAKINHPNIVNIHSLGQESEPPHFVMEHVEGVPLLQAAADLPLRQKIRLFLKVVKPVAYLHEAGMIHRDLKPANILIQPNHEPKIVDFGLALRFEDSKRELTLEGELLGTPAYFSPEQADAEPSLDVRSDVFTLGVILYELITGEVPFTGNDLNQQIQAIYHLDPVPPSRLNREVPRELQNICLQALEKNRADRYSSAGDFARDLERFLGGDHVIASPRSYSRMMSEKIEKHLQELEQWKHDRILSNDEFDSFRKLYDRLIDREDTWIMEMRRFSLTQVLIYFGAWLLVIGGFLFTLFEYEKLPPVTPILFNTAATLGAGFLGLRYWRKFDRKKAVPVLLSFCLLLPSTFILVMQETGSFTHVTNDDLEQEIFYYFSTLRLITNSQLWWSILFSMPFYFWIRKATRSSVFSLVISSTTALWCLVSLSKLGVIEWFESDPGKPFFYLLPFAAVFLTVGLLLEHFERAHDSRYFYPVAVTFTLISLSGVAAFHEPYAAWLEQNLPFTRGQVEYLFLINGLIYWILQKVCERVATSQMRRVAHAFRFFIPGHILGAVLFLGLNASDIWSGSPQDFEIRFEARFFQILLLLLSGLFVFAAIPKQMKNFLATGMLFLAVGIVRIQQDLLADWISWPLSLMVSGFLIILGAGSFHLLKNFTGSKKNPGKIRSG